MSVAVGLSFTGCGNSGSTGSTFEPVPLIDEGNEGVGVGASTLDGKIYISISLYQDGKFSLYIFNKDNDNDHYNGYDLFSGASWSATQLPNNTYQISLSDITARGCKCTLKCNDKLTLTIPEDQLEAYRKGELVDGATLYVDFTHEVGDSCSLPDGTGAIQGTMAAKIKQAAVLED